MCEKSVQIKFMISFIHTGTCVRHKIDKLDPLQCYQAFLEYKEIESKISSDSFMVFTDGSVKEGSAGSGAVIYLDGETLHEILAPVGDQTISYAELYAVYLALIWLRDHPSSRITHDLDTIKPIHIFTDSMYVFNILTKIYIPKKHFSLIEDIKNIASFLNDDYSITIHWIPSHIEKTSFGEKPIIGNDRADTLADLAQERSTYQHNNLNINLIRKQIMAESARLISSIDDLLKLNHRRVPTGGPSIFLDDFSRADAIRNVSENVP